MDKKVNEMDLVEKNFLLYHLIHKCHRDTVMTFKYTQTIVNIKMIYNKCRLKIIGSTAMCNKINTIAFIMPH